jgi:protein-disulfide isomerase/uncharacterized membrane protein
MRKFSVPVLILSIAGVFLSGYLLWLHYAAGSVLPSWLPCGDPSSSCSSLAQSDYSAIFGIPIASFGFFFYLWIAGIAASVVISGYLSTAIVLGFIVVAAAGLGVDAVLGGVLIATHNFCALCVLTYFINITLFAVSILVFRREHQRDCRMISKTVAAAAAVCHDRKKIFRLCLSGAYSVFAVLFVAAGTFALNGYFSGQESNRMLVKSYVERVTLLPETDIHFPATKLSAGNPAAPIFIAVFTDPFCGACREFYYAEKSILEEFAGAVRVSHYFLPLDPSCNIAVRGEGHNHSCAAAANIAAAADLGFYDEFADAHWDSIEKSGEIYDKSEDPSFVLEKFLPRRHVAAQFALHALSAETKALIKRDVDFAHSLGVKGTPAVFVNGKRLPFPVTLDTLRGVVISRIRGERY